MLEYKSPNTVLNYDAFLKGVAYVYLYLYLYKTNETFVDEISLEDVTLSFIRDRKPLKLFKKLKKEKFHIEEMYPAFIILLKMGL